MSRRVAYANVTEMSTDDAALEVVVRLFLGESLADIERDLDHRENISLSDGR